VRKMLTSKIHRARSTRVNPDYEGSISIGRTLMEQADLYPYEKVDVLSVNSGARFSTCVPVEEDVSGIIGLDGAAAGMALANDSVILVSCRAVGDAMARTRIPVVVHGDERNRVH